MTTLFQPFRCWNAILLVSILALGSGCRKKDSEFQSDLLNVAVAVEVASLDPQITTSIASIKIQSALFETLLKIDSKSGEMLPAGAESWEISGDGLCYRFNLRKDAQWSDGEPITASDYAFSFKRLLTPELGAPFANLYDAIEGAEEYNCGKSLDFADVGVKVLNPYRLEIRLHKSVPYFLSLLARPCTAAIPREWILSRGELYSRTSNWSLIPGFPASGPYVLEEWTVNKWISVVKNPHHRDASIVAFEKILFHPMESAYLQEQGFRAGSIDITSTLASEQVAKYEESAQLAKQPEMGTYYVITNTNSPKLKDREIRRLLSRAIHREAISKTLRRRGEQSAYSFCPPIWGDRYPVQSKHGDASDLSDAKLKEAEQMTLKLLISSSENNNLIAEALQDMWRTRLGINVEIYRQEWKSYLDSRNRGQFDLCLATWIGDYFDPLTFLEMWKSESPNNFAQWRNSQFDQLLEESGGSVNQRSRFELLREAEEMMLSEQAIIPLFYLSRVYLVSEKVEYWPQTILNTVDYSSLRRNRN